MITSSYFSKSEIERIKSLVTEIISGLMLSRSDYLFLIEMMKKNFHSYQKIYADLSKEYNKSPQSTNE